MATYECSKCGMSVNATCAKCDAPLVNDMLTTDDGTQVQISKWPKLRYSSRNEFGFIMNNFCNN